MRISNTNGTIAIVTGIAVADLKEPQKVYDRKGNEVYSIRKAGVGESGSISKHGAVLNGEVDGKAAFIMIKPEGFDYDKFKESMTKNMEQFYSAEQVVIEGLQIYNKRVARMWSELEDGGCTCGTGTCINPTVDCDENDKYDEDLCSPVDETEKAADAE